MILDLVGDALCDAQREQLADFSTEERLVQGAHAEGVISDDERRELMGAIEAMRGAQLRYSEAWRQFHHVADKGLPLGETWRPSEDEPDA
jgi:hypothetical protein